MCGTIANLRQDKRTRCDLPSGKVVSPVSIDQYFSDVSRERRGELSRRALGALPKNERIKFDAWVETTTKARPVDLHHKELMMFLAVGNHAIEKGASIDEMVGAIVEHKSASGIIFAAA